MRLKKNNNQIRQVTPAAEAKAGVPRDKDMKERLLWQLLRKCQAAEEYKFRSEPPKEHFEDEFTTCIGLLQRLKILTTTSGVHREIKKEHVENDFNTCLDLLERLKILSSSSVKLRRILIDNLHEQICSEE